MSNNTGSISSINSLRSNDEHDTPWDTEIWVGDTLISWPRNEAAIKAGLEAKKADREATIRQEFIEAAEYNRGY